MMQRLIATGIKDCWDYYTRLPDRTNSFLLDSTLFHESLACYSFFSCRPRRQLRSQGKKVEIREADGPWRAVDGEPLQWVQSWLKEQPVPEGSFPFTGGVVGYIGYDYRLQLERLKDRIQADVQVYDLYLSEYDWVLVLDHLTEELWLVGVDGRVPETEIMAWMSGPGEKPGSVDAGYIRSNYNHEDYLYTLEQAREHIRQGSIYQVNISQRLNFPIKGDHRRLYEVMRRISPSYFGACLIYPEYSVYSTSPELFLRRRQDQLETRPIKGTRPRGKDPREDQEMEAELKNSTKDQAELLMIVDLMRNDLGRICKPGTVTVEELFAVRRYATVYHLDAVVRGRQQEDLDVESLIRATFPGGSITGAPKIAAMNVIEELEPTRRGIYTGSIGYFGYNGNVDLSIVIRTLVVKDGQAYYQTGGGITIDSVPEDEWDETWHKARVLTRALMEVDAGAGLDQPDMARRDGDQGSDYRKPV